MNFKIDIRDIIKQRNPKWLVILLIIIILLLILFFSINKDNDEIKILKDEIDIIDKEIKKAKKTYKDTKKEITINKEIINKEIASVKKLEKEVLFMESSLTNLGNYNSLEELSLLLEENL